MGFSEDSAAFEAAHPWALGGLLATIVALGVVGVVLAVSSEEERKPEGAKPEGGGTPLQAAPSAL